MMENPRQGTAAGGGAAGVGAGPWITMTAADSDQAIGSPVDPHSQIASSSEVAGLWAMTLDQDGVAPRDEVDELGRWMFDPTTLLPGFAFDGSMGIAFRLTPTVWPATGLAAVVAMGMISESGTGGSLDGFGLGLHDFNAGNDQIGGANEVLWTPVDTFSGRVSSLRSVWVPNGDPTDGNFGLTAVQGIRSTAGGPPFTYHTMLGMPQPAIQTGPIRIFLGFGFRATGSQTAIAVSVVPEARIVNLFPGWPEA